MSNTSDQQQSSQLHKIIEGALLAAGRPLNIQQIQQLFEEGDAPAKDEVSAALEDLQSDCKDRGFELKEIASGWRFQVRQELSPWIGRLWEEKPQKYSRALLETLSLIAYRQPITRGDIEEIRGVAVSSHIMRTLMERGWVRVVGHRDVPGRPAMYATTREFLDYFNLRSLEELPTLAEIRDLDSINEELDLGTAPAPKSELGAGAGTENELETEADTLLVAEELAQGSQEIDSESEIEQSELKVSAIPLAETTSMYNEMNADVSAEQSGENNSAPSEETF